MEKLIITNPAQIYDHFDEYLSGDMKGIIELPVNVANINEWRTNGTNCYGAALGMDDRQMEKILYYADRVVKDPKGTDHQIGEIVAIGKNDGAEYIYGVDAIEFLLSRVDLKAMLKELRTTEITCMQALERFLKEEDAAYAKDESEGGSEAIRALSEQRDERIACLKKLHKTRDTMDAVRFVYANGASRLKISKISLFPLELRRVLAEMQQVQPCAVMDELSSLYSSIVLRCGRLKHLEDLGAPDIILVNERRMIQERVDRLIYNGKRGTLYSPNTCSEDEEPDEYFYAAPSLTELVLKSIQLC